MKQVQNRHEQKEEQSESVIGRQQEADVQIVREKQMREVETGWVHSC